VFSEACQNLALVFSIPSSEGAAGAQEVILDWCGLLVMYASMHRERI